MLVVSASLRKRGGTQRSCARERCARGEELSCAVRRGRERRESMRALAGVRRRARRAAAVNVEQSSPSAQRRKEEHEEVL